MVVKLDTFLKFNHYKYFSFFAFILKFDLFFLKKILTVQVSLAFFFIKNVVQKSTNVYKKSQIIGKLFKFFTYYFTYVGSVMRELFQKLLCGLLLNRETRTGHVNNTGHNKDDMVLGTYS